MLIKDESNFKKLSVANGKIVERTNQNDPKGIPRQIESLNETVYELRYDGIVGYIIDIIKNESESYGNSFAFVFKDEDEFARLYLNESSPYLLSFISHFPNLDLNEKVEVRAFDIKDNDKGKTNKILKPYQNGVKVDKYFTKSASEYHGIPDVEEKEYKGRTVYDYTRKKRAIIDFSLFVYRYQKNQYPTFWKGFSEFLNPEGAKESQEFLQKKSKNSENYTENSENSQKPDNGEIESDDDLPF